LADTLINLIQDRASAEAIGSRGKQVFDQQAGATGRCVDALRKLLLDRYGVNESAGIEKAAPRERPA